MTDVMFSGSCSPQGHLHLVETIAKVYSERFGRQIDPLTEILVSCGAYGSLYYITQALLNPGDEVFIHCISIILYTYSIFCQNANNRTGLVIIHLKTAH